jgi:hypothetical protein
MQTTVTTDDHQEALRIVKSLDLALALWDIHQLTYEEEISQEVADKINAIFTERGIIIEELIS